MTEANTLQESDMSAIAQSVSIIVPTLNEAENIGPLVSQIVATGVSFREIVFVDDRSTDGTQEIIRSLGRDQPVRLIERESAELGLAGARSFENVFSGRAEIFARLVAHNFAAEPFSKLNLKDDARFIFCHSERSEEPHIRIRKRLRSTMI